MRCRHVQLLGDRVQLSGTAVLNHLPSPRALFLQLTIFNQCLKSDQRSIHMILRSQYSARGFHQESQNRVRVHALQKPSSLVSAWDGPWDGPCDLQHVRFIPCDVTLFPMQTLHMPISWGSLGGQCRHTCHTWSVWVWDIGSALYHATGLLCPDDERVGAGFCIVNTFRIPDLQVHVTRRHSGRG